MKEKNDKVSIIVPIYNVEKYVEKCLESLINQTYKNIEILAVIDGSPDNSVSIVKKMAKKDKRIKCIEKENGGYGSVLQYSIGIIDSKYFLICDPDDWLDKKCVETLYKEAEKDNLDIVCGDKYLVYSNNYETIRTSNMDNNISFEKNVVLKDYKAKQIVMLNTTPHSKLYKTELAKGLVFPKKVSFTDFLLFICVSNRVLRSKYIDIPLSYYLIDREGNSVSTYSKKAFDAKILVFKSSLDILEQDGINNEFIIYKLYIQIRNVIIEFASKLDKKEKKEAKNDIYICFSLIKKYRKYIYRMIKRNKKIKNLIELILAKLLFNHLLSRLIIALLLKYNSNKGKVKK